jgi:phenylalanyl-tRNA synthetase beta chain
MNAVRNIRRGNDEGREFEIANIYIPNGKEQPIEKKRLVLGVWGGKNDFFDLKGAVEYFAKVFHLEFSYTRAEKTYLHPGVSANILLDKQIR